MLDDIPISISMSISLLHFVMYLIQRVRIILLIIIYVSIHPWINYFNTVHFDIPARLFKYQTHESLKSIGRYCWKFSDDESKCVVYLFIYFDEFSFSAAMEEKPELEVNSNRLTGMFRYDKIAGSFHNTPNNQKILNSWNLWFRSRALSIQKIINSSGMCICERERWS